MAESGACILANKLGCVLELRDVACGTPASWQAAPHSCSSTHCDSTQPAIDILPDACNSDLKLLQVKATSTSGLGYLDEHVEAGWAMVPNIAMQVFVSPGPQQTSVNSFFDTPELMRSRIEVWS